MLIPFYLKFIEKYQNARISVRIKAEKLRHFFFNFLLKHNYTNNFFFPYQRSFNNCQRQNFFSVSFNISFHKKRVFFLYSSKNSVHDKYIGCDYKEIYINLIIVLKKYQMKCYDLSRAFTIVSTHKGSNLFVVFQLQHYQSLQMLL